jgi:serine/threonine protein kinase
MLYHNFFLRGYFQKIGEGNFGIVYKGFGIECGKEFAIKVIKAKVSDAMER